MIEFIKEFGITFLCFFIGYSVVECVTGKEKKKESPTARLPDYFNNNNDGKIIKWKQSRRYRGGRN